MPTDPAFIRADKAIHRRFPMMAPKQRAEIIGDVLNAIRGPEEAVCKAAIGIVPDTDFGSPENIAEEAFTAMIDAILIQDPGIPVVGRLVADPETGDPQS